jgi:hypothetical protein
MVLLLKTRVYPFEGGGKSGKYFARKYESVIREKRLMKERRLSESV